MKHLLVGVMLFLLSPYATAQAYVGVSAYTFGINAGYRVNRYLGVEAGFVAPQSKDEDVMPVGWIGTQTESHKSWDVDGFRLSGVGYLPLSDEFSLLGRASLYRLKGKYSESAVTRSYPDCAVVNPCVAQVLSSTQVNSAQNSTDTGLGVGVEWRASPRYSFRAIYESVKSPLSLDGRVNMSSVDFLMTF